MDRQRDGLTDRWRRGGAKRGELVDHPNGFGANLKQKSGEGDFK